jgi:hypothetical protein
MRINAGIALGGLLFIAMTVGCGRNEGPVAAEIVEQTEHALAPNTFGVHATQDYENNYQAALVYQWEMTSRFVNRLATTDTSKYYFNLWGKSYYWHDTGDHASLSLEDADLFFTTTHGGIMSDSSGMSNAVWAMWNNWELAWSRQMRLGDELTGLSIFAQVSCETLLTSDGLVIDRWAPAFAGGLRVALGSHDLLANSTTKGPVGEDFATYLQAEYRFVDAWYWALANPGTADDIAVMYSGSTVDDCWNRYGMTWRNFQNYPRRQADLGYLCWWHWDDV